MSARVEADAPTGGAIVRIAQDKAAEVNEWLGGAAQPLARVLDQLAPDERAAFLKAMDMPETELRLQEDGRSAP